MEWHPMDEKPPNNEDVLCFCLMGKDRMKKPVFRYLVGKYCTGLEWWEFPYPTAEPLAWTPIERIPYEREKEVLLAQIAK